MLSVPRCPRAGGGCSGGDVGEAGVGREKEGMGETPPQRNDGPTGPAPSGKWDGSDRRCVVVWSDRRRGVPWCGGHHGRRGIVIAF